MRAGIPRPAPLTTTVNTTTIAGVNRVAPTPPTGAGADRRDHVKTLLRPSVPREPRRSHRVRGYLVHAYTASGLALVALSAQALLRGDYRWALVFMALTIFVDATDGVLARRYRVGQTAVTLDGRRLDDIVDFLSFVFLPMLFMLQTGMLREPAVAYAGTALFASAIGFSRVTAKQAEEGFFVGFPSYWNIVVGYLYVLGTSTLFNTVVVVSLSFMVLVPLRFMYLTQLPRQRRLQCTVAVVWGVVCLVVLLLPPGEVKRAFALATLAYPVYYTAYSMHLDMRARADARRDLQGTVPADEFRQPLGRQVAAEPDRQQRRETGSSPGRAPGRPTRRTRPCRGG